MTKKKGLEAAENSPATKKDLSDIGKRLEGEIVAAKKDSSDLGQRLAIEIVNLQADVREIKATMVSHVEFRQGLATMTAIASRFDQEHKATLIHGQSLTEVEVRVADHERRLTTLESKAGL
jgi:hypothetical protein